MYKRLDRFKLNQKVFSKRSDKGIIDYYDTVLKASLRLYDQELDFLATNLKDSEIEFLIKEDKNFQEKRELIKLLEKYLNNSI